MAMVEQQYLALREKLKEAYRKKRSLENSNGVTSVRNDDYGSFFGPSVTILATGLNRESNTLFQKLSSNSMNKKEKVERIKEARDYSFLFSDARVSVDQSKLDSRKKVSVDQSKVASNGSAKQLTLKNQTKPKGFPSKTTLPNVENNEKMQKREKSESEAKSKQFNLKIRLKRPSSSEDSKKRPLGEIYSGSEGEKALSMVRRMFNTKRFQGRDDSDRVMEATFGDIVKEEKRSERVGRKEDLQQLRLIQLEEKRTQMAKRHRH
ncbi:uncharacterized protein [Euphorbia lathyris]|uniref:uncharacterized protein n=1 Tax=Euphorbia lathyris TaxID=212925 RepID=UPI0033141DFA